MGEWRSRSLLRWKLLSRSSRKRGRFVASAVLLRTFGSSWVVEMDKVFQESWSYTLYRDGARYILSVVCGGVGMYTLNIPLDDEEASAAGDQAAVADLAKRIRTNPKQYADRSIKL